MIHADHRSAMARVAVVLALLTLGLLLALALPAPTGLRGIPGYATVHAFLEVISVVIAGLVFAVGWNAYRRDMPAGIVLLSEAFLAVALLDFSHGLSYVGMPVYVTPSSAEKAINFWLAARLFAALALLAVALAPWRPLRHRATRYGVLAAVLGATAAAHAVFLLRPGMLPRTFVPGIGLTTFKIVSEYVLIGADLAAALALWRRLRTPQPFDVAAIFVAACTMALSEVFFTLYGRVDDLYNLMGHLYKVIAYLFLYRAIFVESVERPQRLLGEEIDQRREIEAALQTAQRLNRQIIEASPVGICIYDRDGDCIDVNPAMALQIGATVDQVRSQNFHRIASWQDCGMYQSALRTLQTGEPTFDVVQARTTFGRDVWLGAYFVALASESGRRLLLMTSDLTELKLAETARQELQANYEQLFASSMDGILLTRLDDGFLLAANPAACSMLGLDEDGIRGRERAGLMDPRDPRAERLMALRAAQGWVRGEVQFVRADGTAFEVELTSTLYRNRDGRGVASTIFRDITQRKRIEAELQALNATLEARVAARTCELAHRNDELAAAQHRTEGINRELEAALAGLRLAQDELVRAEKMASLGSLVAGVAHELSTPIGNAVMMASTLAGRQREFEDSMAGGVRRLALEGFLDGTREISDVLERNLRRAAELIGSFKQVAVDQASYQRRPFQLDDVVREIALALTPTLRNSGVRLVDETQAGLHMDSYPGPLGQVLINLVNNAIVHAFGGASPGTVRVAAEPLGADRVRLAVTDDGQGIAREHLKQIFDPFFTTRLGQGGSGLGLHIVYTLVTGPLGGRIEVRSTPGQGTQFLVDLPRVAPIAADLPIAAA